MKSGNGNVHLVLGVAVTGVGHGPLGQLRLDYAREAEASVLNTGHGTMQARWETTCCLEAARGPRKAALQGRAWARELPLDRLVLHC